MVSNGKGCREYAKESQASDILKYKAEIFDKGRVAITTDYCPFSKPNFRAYKGILLMQTARVCSRMV